jgi:lipoprotein-anchoring transpeptidase ErfK/SrfK
VTDLASKPGAGEASADNSAPSREADGLEEVAADAAGAGTSPSDTPGTGDPTYEWAPAEPTPRKSRKALWISLTAGAAAVGLVASSLVLIAPGTSVAGVPVGGMTPGAAADAITQRLAGTTVVLTGAGGDAEITGADLGASVDAEALAHAAFEERPMWNVTGWFAGASEADISIDAAVAAAALREAAPELHVDPVDATLAFDSTATNYVTTPAVDGTGIDVVAVEAALQRAFDTGQERVEFDAVALPVAATTTTETAEATAATLNTILDQAGFYVGPERTVPVDRAVAASWLTVTPTGDGEFEITADADAIQEVAEASLAGINREAVNATVITDSDGDVLSEVTAGVDGRALGDISGVGEGYAAALGGGSGVYEVPVTTTPATTTALARRIEVDLSDQRVYMFENGDVVNSYAMSSGLPGYDTITGNYRITAKLRQQNMGNPDLTKAPFYYTQNVPWVMYFNGDQALHGAYWHNNFGRRMSHGCVNLPVEVAAFMYQWAPMGTEVWVHA